MIVVKFLSLFLFLSALCCAQIESFSVGGVHSLAVNQKGEVFTWGGNFYGQLGVGDFKGRNRPEKIASLAPVAHAVAKRDHACILFKDGSVKCFGSNFSGELGLGRKDPYVGSALQETIEKLPALLLGSLRPEKLILGFSHTCVLFQGGVLKCFGTNTSGELGIGKKISGLGAEASHMGDALETALLGSSKVIDGCAGRGYTCLLTENREVKCVGSAILNGTGSAIGTKPEELGENLKTVSLGTSAKVEKLTCGEFSVCVLLDSGEVKCWGKNVSGVLGLGIAEGNSLGGKPNEMGDALPAVSLEPGLPAKAIECGSSHCCAILSNCAVKCWGKNSSGQLGLGDSKDRGALATDMGSNLPYVDLGDGYCAETLSLGSVSSCAKLKSGELKCWGGNQSGQLGIGVGPGTVGVFPTHMGEMLKSVQLEK